MSVMDIPAVDIITIATVHSVIDNIAIVIAGNDITAAPWIADVTVYGVVAGDDDTTGDEVLFMRSENTHNKDPQQMLSEQTPGRGIPVPIPAGRAPVADIPAIGIAAVVHARDNQTGRVWNDDLFAGVIAAAADDETAGHKIFFMRSKNTHNAPLA